MTTEQGSNNAAFYMGRQIVILHDEHGLPFDLSLEMSMEQKIPVALLGILAEAAKRKLSKRLLVQMCEKWAKCNTPRPAEKLGLACLGIES